MKLWETDETATVTYTIIDQDSGAKTSRTLERNQTLLIFNWDHHIPTPEQFADLTPTKCLPNTKIDDIDFRWLYELLIAPGDDWKAWLRTADLPAPIFICPERTADDLRTAPGSDCIDAVWHCD